MVRMRVYCASPVAVTGVGVTLTACVEFISQFVSHLHRDNLAFLDVLLNHCPLNLQRGWYNRMRLRGSRVCASSSAGREDEDTNGQEMYRAGLALLSQQVPSRQVDETVLLDNLGTLSALSSARPTQNEQDHRSPGNRHKMLCHDCSRIPSTLLDGSFDGSLRELEDLVLLDVSCGGRKRAGNNDWWVTDATGAAHY